jgi:aspartate/methionine/tyrosine aminotransferase
VAYPFILTKLLARTGLGRLLITTQQRTDGAGEFLRYYGDRVLAAPLDDLGRAADFYGVSAPDAIDLAHGVPPQTRAAVPEIRNTKPESRNSAWGLPELREAVADWLHADYHISVSPTEEVLITHGASGAFSTAVDAFLNPGNAVVLFDPCSPLFPMVLRQRRAKIRWVPTWADGGHVRFQLDPLARALRGAKLLVLADPANPTGGTFAPEDLEQIAWWANRHDVLILQDDSFARFQYDGDRQRLAAFPAAAKRTVTFGSVSKSHSLPALRVGWLAAHRHLARPCALTQTLTAPFVAPVCQHLALAALRTAPETFVPLLAQLRSRRQFVFERLRALGLSPLWPAGGFFFWLPVQPLGFTGSAFAGRLLRSKKVLLSPGDLYGPGGGGWLRLSYAGDEGRLLEGLSRLAEFLADVRPPLARLAPEDAKAA